MKALSTAAFHHLASHGASVAGFVLSGLGLASLGMGLVHGTMAWLGRPASAVSIAVLLTVGCLLGGLGFGLLVVGCDPFDEGEFGWEPSPESEFEVSTSLADADPFFSDPSTRGGESEPSLGVAGRGGAPLT